MKYEPQDQNLIVSSIHVHTSIRDLYNQTKSESHRTPEQNEVARHILKYKMAKDIHLAHVNIKQLKNCGQRQGTRFSHSYEQ